MKKIIFIVLLFVFLIFVSQPLLAGTDTIIQNYPDIPGAKKPGEGDPGKELPQLIQYIFQFSLGLVGIVGILALVFAAFGYLTSVGDPAKAAKSKERIVAALLGILLLLGSYILIRIVNPDLLKLGIEAEKVSVTTDSSLLGCHYTKAELSPTAIKEGESIILTLYRANCTSSEVNSHKIDVAIKQVMPNGIDTRYKEVEKRGELIENSEEKWAIKYTFPVVLNNQENKFEQFYIDKIKIERPGKKNQYFSGLYFIVEDNE